MAVSLMTQLTGFSGIHGDLTCEDIKDILCSLGIENDFNKSCYHIFPGFCDVHVHFREPGFCYKEDIATGTAAAAHGGYTDVCTMPNLSPVQDSVEHIMLQHEAIKKKAVINVHPYAAITIGEKGEELTDMEELSKYSVAFSDDGKGVQCDAMMESAMLKAKNLGKLIAAHCEVNSLLEGGYIHKGKYAQEHNHRGICPESEYLQIARDIELCEKTGCAYHVCHISSKESVDIIRQAKKRGVNITCETGPHYLIMDDSDLKEEGRFKMNPPLRDKTDREALIEGIKDGTIDMIATDHAPHSAEEKSKGLEGSAFGITGLETAFPALYTHLVKPGVISLEKLIELLTKNPRTRFGINPGRDFSVWDLNAKYKVNPDDFLSKGKATPFEGEEFYGVCLLTVHDGKIVYRHN